MRASSDSGSGDGDVAEVILHSSRRSWFFAIVGSFALIGGPLAVSFSRPLGKLGIGALAVGLVSTVALLIDQPIRSTVGSTGIERRCPALTRTIDWSEIESLERLRRSGGIVAKVGRRRMVLCDRREGHLEHQLLKELIEAHAENVIVRLQPPPLDSRPTNLYRR